MGTISIEAIGADMTIHSFTLIQLSLKHMLSYFCNLNKKYRLLTINLIGQ